MTFKVQESIFQVYTVYLVVHEIHPLKIHEAFMRLDLFRIYHMKLRYIGKYLSNIFVITIILKIICRVVLLTPLLMKVEEVGGNLL